MRYFLVKTTAGNVEVLASNAQDAISKAQRWADRYGETVQGIENSENGGVDPATGQARGNSVSVSGPSTPTLGFERPQQQSPTLGGTGGQGTGTGQPVKPIGNIAEQLGGVGGYLSDPNTNAFGSFVSEEGPAGMEGAFRRAFANRGVKFNNLAGRALLGQQSLYENPFKMLQAAGIDQTTDPDAFYNYARGGVNPYQAGKDAFGKIYGASRGEAPTAQVQEFAVPSSETGFNNSLSLARGALGRSGAYLSDNLLSGLKGEYAAQPAANTGNLLDFLYKRLGIQGVR